MLELRRIQEHRDLIIAGLQNRCIQDAEQQVDDVIALDQNRKRLQLEYDEIMAQLNQISKQIGQLMKSGNKEEAEKVKEQTAKLKDQAKVISGEQKEVVEKLQKLLLQIPNIPHDQVPVGQNSKENKIIDQWGEVPMLMEKAEPHWELVEQYSLVDFELGNKVTGAGFPFYWGKGAKLQRALVSFFLDEAEKAGYLEVQPPLVVNKDSGQATGQLPDKEGQMYEIVDQELFLIPTAEVPVTNIYRDMILEQAELPKRHVAYSQCFRREAGSWGAHVRGLNRLHQFDKVELVCRNKE
jgi:seryl-tRNA synthetase